MTISFVVGGVPQPQGSKTPIVRNGVAVVIEGRRGPARRAFKAWRSAVEIAARAAQLQTRLQSLDGPLRVELTFRMPRPAAAKKRAFPAVRPDIDKLCRAVLDALTSSGLIADDSRIVAMQATKLYATGPADTGVTVSLDVLDPSPEPQQGDHAA